MRAERIKAKIKEDLLGFKPAISVSQYDAQRLFNETLSENPEILVYLYSYTYTGSVMGGTFKVTYKNTDVALSEIVYAKNEVEIEDALHTAIRRIQNRRFIVVKDSLNIKSVFDSFSTLYQGFYSNLLQTKAQYQSMSGLNFTCACFTFEFRLGRVKLNMMELAVNKKVKELNSLLFTPDMKPAVKAYVAHNYLARTVSYWHKADATPLEKSYMQSAYGALINGKCVCQGYAEAYKRILDEQNVICEVICGKVRGSAEHHAWNIISLDGKEFYHVDVTWDSRGGGVKNNEYYGKTDAQMSADRIWTRRPNMICNGSKNILQEAKVQIALGRAKYIAKGIDKTYLE